MKKILSSVVLIFLVTLLTVSFSKANFLDTESGNDNSFTAGTFLISDGGTTLVPFHFESLRPGDHVIKTISLKNSGSVNISGLTVSTANQTGDTGLLEQIKVSVVSGTTYFTDDFSRVSPWMTNVNILNGVITLGQTYVLEFSFDIPATISPDWQEKSTGFDMQFRAEQ